MSMNRSAPILIVPDVGSLSMEPVDPEKGGVGDPSTGPAEDVFLMVLTGLFLFFPVCFFFCLGEAASEGFLRIPLMNQALAELLGEGGVT